ncbi:MAG: FtsX-like permease family protein [Ruminococcus sp.]|nr:FtsX-like permease family protein [Ruminococcus sp.]
MTSLLLYPRLALGGIMKNRQTYFPYILACSGMTAMYYIVSFLCRSDMVAELRGGEIMQSMLVMGCIILVLFSAVFLIYTNSFLVRRRRREFGLYNILGLGKGNIARIMLWETVVIYVSSEIIGLMCGILFSKLSEMLLVKMLGGENSYTFDIKPRSVYEALICFGVISLIILAGSLFKVHLSNPIELLHSNAKGEKPPRSNIPFALTGTLLLAAAYYMAVTEENPIKSIGVFFVAVIMVIIATYLLFIAGSVTVCRLMQRNRDYYYKTSHFVSVSQMSYRMRRNGAGLASICILATMVLVTLSTTTCLYAGMEDMLRKNYPRQFITETYSDDPDIIALSRNVTLNALSKENTVTENTIEYNFLRVGCSLKNDLLYFSTDNWKAIEGEAAVPEIKNLYLISIDDYNRTMGKSETLGENEIILFADGDDYGYKSLNIYEYGTLFVKEKVTDFEPTGTSVVLGITGDIYAFVNGELFDKLNLLQREIFGDNASEVHNYYAFDVSLDNERQIALYDSICLDMAEANHGEKLFSYLIDSRAYNRGDFISIYGGLFFLGVLLGSVFICAAVLIMYYKQISEGYEDRQRFEVLQKVGMTDREIRQSINSQVLTVFFLPLAAAGVHTCFAFPLLTRLLALFGLHDVRLFAIVAVLCFLVFGALYVLVYFLTSRSYFRIVAGYGSEKY